MNNVEPSNREPLLGVKDLEAWVEDLSKEPPLPEGGLLRGEVLGLSGDGRRGQLRGAGRATVEVLLEQPISAQRGDNIEVAGVPELVAEAVPVGLRLVWRGVSGKNHGTSSRFRARRASVEAHAAKLPFATPRIDASLRHDGRVRLVTERHSKAWADLEEASRQYRWLKPEPLYCENMADPAALAATLTSALPLVNVNDVLLVAGGSELAALDVLEDERVVGALVRLTARCPTILAVGHTGDELLTNKVVTYPVDSARAAIHLILMESGEPSAEPERPRRIEPEPVEHERRSSAPPSAPIAPRLLLRVLLLGAAVFLGWWARGIAGDNMAPDGQAGESPAPAVAADRR